MFLTVHIFVDFGISRCKGLGILTHIEVPLEGTVQQATNKDPFLQTPLESAAKKAIGQFLTAYARTMYF